MCKLCQILHFILKIYHNFESHQNMLTTLGFCFFYHKLQICFICHAHYASFTCGKRLLKFFNFGKYLEFLKFKIPYLLNCECFLNLGSRLLSSKFFYHQIYVITIVIYLIVCKINHNLTQLTYSSSKVFFKTQNPKFNLMNF